MAAPPWSITFSSSMTSHPKVVSMTTWPPTPSLSSLPLTSPSEAISKTKTPLNSIFGEMREGEIFMVLGASGFNMSTLINALMNYIMRENL
ncbi:unnamed protein product [Musa textilis]